jgi:hypothetical protein
MAFNSSVDSDYVISNTEYTKFNTTVIIVEPHLDTDIEVQLIIDYRTILNAYIVIDDLVEGFSSNASVGALEYKETDMEFSNDANPFYIASSGLKSTIDIVRSAEVNVSLIASLDSTAMSEAPTDVNPISASVDTGFTLLFPPPLTKNQLSVLKSL